MTTARIFFIRTQGKSFHKSLLDELLILDRTCTTAMHVPQKEQSEGAFVLCCVNALPPDQTFQPRLALMWTQLFWKHNRPCPITAAVTPETSFA
jgi:hypothetical protein